MEGDLVDVLYVKFTADKTVQVHVEVQVQVQTERRISLDQKIINLYDEYVHGIISR